MKRLVRHLALALTMTACRSGAGGADAGPPAAALDFEAIDVEGGLDLATDLRFLPGGDELLVAGKDGGVTHLRLRGDRAERLGHFQVPGVYSRLDCGLISLALDPDFADNGYLYAGACASMTESAIVRLTFQPDDHAAIAATAVEILRAGDPAADRPWHNIGSIGFDSTGAMWALFGDKVQSDNGQDLDDDLGAVVRILPSRDRDRGGHEPAPDNPFLGMLDHDPDVYAYGLRSPWRGAVDSAGRLWIGDVGAHGAEEINVLAGPGDNFGWSIHEGPCTGGGCAGLRDPVAWWVHTDAASPYLLDDAEAVDTIARAGWVGIEPRPPAGTDDPYGGRLAGHMLFGDFCLGFVRGLAIDGDGAVVSDQHLGHLANASAWDQGPDGHLYATTFGQCQTDHLDPPPQESRLWRAVPAALR
jgi:glucose/arabinose dehydrogenase